MASPLKTGKQIVDTGSRAPGSRIRRDPPPPAPAKRLEVRNPDQNDRRMAIIGIVSVALALFVIIVGFSSVGGWTPRQYIARF